MNRSPLSVLLALALLAPAHADVTIKATTTGKGLGMSGTMPNVTYIKGQKMRVETELQKKSLVSIFDVENQKMYVLDTKKMEAEVWDMATFSQELSSSVSVEGGSASLTPNGQTKTVAGQSADGYDVEVIVPATIGGAGGMKVTVAQTGTSWIVKDAPGAAEYAAFYQSAAEKGWIFSDPNAAKGAPGQAKAMAQMFTQFARVGGLPYETEVDIKIQGDGPMAALMSRMGGVSMLTTTESVDTNPISDDLFQVPADYKLKQKQ